MEHSKSVPKELESEGSLTMSSDQEEEYFKSDAFRMSSMKVLPCSKRFVHDWTECPFAHPQEKARRRDPRVYNYTGIACPSMKKEGACAFGDHCPYAHNVFEYWLHPTRYRTQLCNDGSNCRRKICFFAHSLDELRVPACKPFVSPEALAEAAAAAASDADLNRQGSSPMAGPLSNNPPALSVFSAMVQTSSPKAAEAAAEADSPFSTQEQQVIDLVTSMLAQNKVTPAQAASILQQMLPSSSLQTLQDNLGLPDQPSAPVGEAGMPVSPFEQPARYSDSVLYGVGDRSAMNTGTRRASLDALQAAQARAELGVMIGPDSGRRSFESERSSFDTARMSFDTNRPSLDLSTPRASLDFPPHFAQTAAPAPVYQPPAPAYPQATQSGSAAGDDSAVAAGTEGPSSDLPPLPSRPSFSNRQRYWAQNQLSTVPEGFPMISAPAPRKSGNWVRRSTGSSMDSAADRLSADYSRMSLESNASGSSLYADTSAVNKNGGTNWYVPPLAPHITNAFASSFFAAEEGHGAAGYPARHSAPAAGYYAGQFGGGAAPGEGEGPRAPIGYGYGWE